MLRLALVIDGSTRHFRVEEGTATLGSGRDNDFVVDCVGVSRRHAVVERRGSRVTLRDAGSKNGIVVAGRRVSEITLENQTDVVLGRAILRLEEIDTGDAELGLSFGDGGSWREGSGGRPTDTISAAGDAARRLLQWVRLSGHGDESVARLLEGAREVLGAATLMIIHGESVIAEIAGPLPPPDALREMAESSPHWMIARHDRDVKMCAYFREPVSASWRHEFLAFVASRLCGVTTLLPAAEGRSELAFGDSAVRGTSPAMARVYEQVEQAVRSDLNVLILGETGTGKEVIARLIHRSDPTRTGEFIVVNTAGVPATMLEAELFGVERGAATDVQARPGAFRAAGRGTILLDEIGDMPLWLQAKLLHVVQSHAVTPLGASLPVPVDVRVISATHQDLQKLVAEGQFRQDLFFRLNGMAITVPPLRARPEDLPQLARAIAESASRQLRKPIRGITANAIQLLLDYAWPGNIRELEYVLKRAVLECPAKGAVETAHIAPSLQSGGANAAPGASLERQRSAAETSAIEDALRAAGGNRTAAARILGISRATLHKKLKSVLKR